MDCTEFDVIVVGMGAMGASACREAARRGLRVLGLEQFTIPNALGSSHGESRIFRIAYYEHADYVPLLQRARRLWLELEGDAGRTLFLQTGGLWIGRPEHQLIAGTLDTACVHDLRHQLMFPSALASRFPQFAVEDSDVGFFEEDAGILLPERAVGAMADLSRRAGATILEHAHANHWYARGGEVVITSNQGVFRAAHLIITAGPWSASLLGLPSLPLRVTRQPTAWFRVGRPGSFDPSRMPCWGVARAKDWFFYGFPVIERDSMKVAIHQLGPTVEPGTVDRTVRPEEISRLRVFLDTTFSGAVDQCAATSVCLYTNTPDGHFIIDRHPAHENVAIGCGFSGHGFKFAPVVGEALVDLAIHGRSELPIGFLGASRLGGVRSPS